MLYEFSNRNLYIILIIRIIDLGGEFMKIIPNVSLILGLIITVFGILPFVFSYPYNDSPNSGPSNLWELILMLSHDLKGWSLFIGIVLLALFFSLIFKQRKLQF